MKSASPSIVHVQSCLSCMKNEKDNSGKLLKGSGAICKLCKQKVAHGGGTTNLKEHSVKKAYNKLFASSLLETQSSLDYKCTC